MYIKRGGGGGVQKKMPEEISLGRVCRGIQDIDLLWPHVVINTRSIWQR